MSQEVGYKLKYSPYVSRWNNPLILTIDPSTSWSRWFKPWPLYPRSLEVTISAFEKGVRFHHPKEGHDRRITLDVGVSENRGFFPPNHHIPFFWGFPIIFTIRFGGKSPYFWLETPMLVSPSIGSNCFGSLQWILWCGPASGDPRRGLGGHLLCFLAACVVWGGAQKRGNIWELSKRSMKGVSFA